MSRRDLDLKSILDIPLWEKIQDELARLTGTAIITIDYKGNPITKHSCRTDFCSVIREDPVFRKRCCRCDALAGLEAVRMGKPYIYLCHCGVVDAAVPVTVGNRYLGAVMFGQVRIPDGDTDAKVERLVSEVSSFQTGSESDRQDLIEMYDRLPEMEYKRIVAIADTLNAIVNYIVDRAVNSENEAMTYKFLLQNSNIQNAAAFSEIQGLKAPELEWGDFPVERELPNAYREVLLVLDGTTGQNGLIQAKQFKEIAGVTALAVTKLDGTAKGGIVIAVADTLDLPVKFIGVGEKAEDLMRFQAKDFVDALFE